MTDAQHDPGLSAAAEEILRARAAALAAMAPDADASENLPLLLFRIAEEWYAVRAQDVREIFQDFRVTPIPCVPEFVLGVVNVRGEILSVCDPARMMCLGSVGASGLDGLPAVVIANESVATALVVDEVGDIVEVADEDIEPPISSIDREQAEFIAGSVFVSERMVGLVNVERMLQPISSQEMRGNTAASGKGGKR